MSCYYRNSLKLDLVFAVELTNYVLLPLLFPKKLVPLKCSKNISFDTSERRAGDFHMSSKFDL